MAVCPVCAEQANKVVRKASIGYIEVLTYKCKNCGLMFLDPVKHSHQLYDTDKRVLPGEIRPEQRNFMTYLRELPVSGGRLIDIGCNDGQLLRAAAKLGFKAAGVELYESKVTGKLRSEGFEIYTGDITKLRFHEKFDVVFMSHIIEHITEPYGFLGAVRSLLKDGGFLVVITPNYNGLIYRLMSSPATMHALYKSDPYRELSFKGGVAVVTPKRQDIPSKNWFRSLEFEHTLQFNKKSLLRLLKKSRFSIYKYPAGNQIACFPGPFSFKQLMKRVILSTFLNNALKAFDLQTELFIILKKGR